MAYKEIFARINKEIQLCGYNASSIEFWEDNGINYSYNSLVQARKKGYLPKTEILLELCDVFQCDMSYLLCQSDFKRKSQEYISEHLHLPERAVLSLLNLSTLEKENAIFSRLITNDEFYRLLGGMASLLEHHEEIKILRKRLDDALELEGIPDNGMEPLKLEHLRYETENLERNIVDSFKKIIDDYLIGDNIPIFTAAARCRFADSERPSNKLLEYDFLDKRLQQFLDEERALYETFSDEKKSQLIADGLAPNPDQEVESVLIKYLSASNE